MWDDTWIQFMEMCENAFVICLWFVMCLKWFKVLVRGKEGEVLFSLMV